MGLLGVGFDILKNKYVIISKVKEELWVEKIEKRRGWMIGVGWGMFFWIGVLIGIDEFFFFFFFIFFFFFFFFFLDFFQFICF